ncbi:hypothetical protein BDV3_005217 [Batrachochytrium dendrobatidis]
MDRSHSVTWLTSPPAKHLSVRLEDPSSPSSSPSTAVSVHASELKPSAHSRTNLNNLKSTSAEYIHTASTSEPFLDSSIPRCFSDRLPTSHTQRKRRRAVHLEYEQDSSRSSSLGFSSLLRECQSAFVDTNQRSSKPLEPVSSIVHSQNTVKQPHQTSDSTLPESLLVSSAKKIDFQSLEQSSTNIADSNIFHNNLDRFLTKNQSDSVSTLTATSKLPTTTLVTPHSSLKKDQGFTRLVVLESIIRATPGIPNAFEKAVRVLDEDLEYEVLVILRNEWQSTELSPGDYIHVTAKSHNGKEFIVDSEAGCIIVHPDHLVTVTAISESFSCLRRAIIKSKVKFRSTNAHIIFGSIIHELFQEALRQRNFSPEFLDKMCIAILLKNTDELYAISMTEEIALDEIRKMIGPMCEWAQLFLHDKLRDSSVLKSQPPSVYTPLLKNQFQVDSIVDIEETVLSHKYGIKGQVDVSATVRFGNLQAPAKLVPIELKSSKRINHLDSHRAQTMMYSLIMSDMYGQEILNGVLAYICRNESLSVPLHWNEIRMMIIMRNMLATHSVSRGRAGQQLPSVIQNEWICSKCYMLDTCILYQKKEGRDITEFGSSREFTERLAHINSIHISFFKKWDTLITLEEPNIEEFSREFFTLSSNDRELIGRCVGMLNVACQTRPVFGVDVSGKSIYTLKKADQNDSINTLNCEMFEGDPVILSVEGSRNRLGTGNIVTIDQNNIVIATSKPLSTTALKQDTLCRLDKDQFSSGSSTVRYYLASIFTEQRFFKTRQLVVDLTPPQFNSTIVKKAFVDHVNASQMNAIDHVLRAQDYALVLGMPGTGKTTVISHILDILVKSGKSILLTSYTHSAVDNILLKIKFKEIEFLRIGDFNKVHPDLKSIVSMQRKKITTVAQAEQYYSNVPIVASTCLGLSHPIFSKRKFDYCIVDEASQIMLPVCLGPIRFANTFILVGDHYQLPPITTQRSSWNEPPLSLFRYLSEAHPSAVAVLEQQYRMNKDIVRLSSTIIYNSKLRCGSDFVANQTIHLPLWDQWKVDAHSFLMEPNIQCMSLDECWLAHTLKPSNAVVFLNTDAVPALEVRALQFIQNEIEAYLVQQVVTSFIECGVSEQEIGVISPYKAQLRIIRELLKSHPQIEILTVDKYQGRDKSCIVLSLVRSNTTGHIGDLLQDWRRINVALTRAKCKLVLIGSLSTLKHTALFSEIFEQLSIHNWIYNLPECAHLIHQSKCTSTCNPQSMHD